MAVAADWMNSQVTKEKKIQIPKTLIWTSHMNKSGNAVSQMILSFPVWIYNLKPIIQLRDTFFGWLCVTYGDIAPYPAHVTWQFYFS